MDSTHWLNNSSQEGPRHQVVLSDLGQRALETADLETFLGVVPGAVAEALAADCVGVLEASPDGAEVVLRSGAGWNVGLVGSATVSAADDSLVGHVLRTPQPVIVDEYLTDAPDSGSGLLADHGLESGIAVGVGPIAEPWGVLGAYTTGHRTFDERDATFLQAVATVLGMAIGAERDRPELAEFHDRISDAFYSLNVDWEFTYLNDRAKELIDFTGAGLVGKNVWETFEWAAESKIRVEYERAMETQKSTSFELYYPDPLESWYEITAYPSETGLSVYFHDVTERKERESAYAEAVHELAESEERLRLALEAGEMGTWELDLQTGHSPVRSPRHDRIFGYEEPVEDWGFATFLEHVHQDDRTEVERRFEAAFETGKWEFECRITRVDGEERVIAAQGEFTFDDEGEPVRAVGVVEDVTERHERERALAEANARLEAATAAGAIDAWEWDVRTNELVGGAAFAEKFGIDPASAIEGVPLEAYIEALHEEDRPRVVDAVEAAVDSCGEYEEEYRVWDANGDLRWVIARGHVECDADGNASSFLGVLIDVTERKRAQLEVKQQSQELETLFEVLPVGAVVAAADGSLLRANDVAKEIWGGDVFDANSVDEYEKYTAVWAETGEPVEPEDWTMSQVLRGERVEEPNVYEISTFDDERRIIMEHGMPVRDERGKVRRAIVTLVDVTAQRAAEAALRESEAKFRTVAENLDEIVWIMTGDATDYHYISPSFDEIWGVDRRTLYDDPKAYERLVHPDDRDRVRERFATLPDAPFDEEFRIVRPDGVCRWLHVRGERVENAEGGLRVIGIGQDITDRVERARELEASNRRLEQFAYAASHDLQEPLRMVSSYLQLLERRYGTDLEQDAREFIDFAVDGADRMRKMIDGLLAYSRVESEGKPFESVELDAVLEDVQTDLQFQIEESGATIVTDALPHVMGDGEQLRQVFQNLVSNAIAYRDDEPPRVHVTAERTGPMWRVSVRDAGVGIDPADTDRVFEVFERLHTSEGHEGTGIGLAICKRIVERHGGEIWVDSEPGEWTTFSVTLPATGA